MSFADVKINRDAKFSFAALGLLFLHTILFGFFWTNPAVINEILENTTQTLIYLAIVSVTFVYIYRHRLLTLFINLSYAVLTIHMFLITILYHSELANPLWSIVQAFAGGTRYRAEFGFPHPGFLSNHMFLILVLSLFFVEIHKNDETNMKTILYGYTAVVIVTAAELLISAAERTGILCTFMVFFLYLWFRFFRVDKRFYILAVGAAFLGFVVCLRLGIVAKVWNLSHRDLNITANYPVFKELGNFWTGMGFVESAGFQKEKNFFHAKTSALDLYYVYIYFSTGFIGCVILGASYLAILYKTLKNAVDLLGKLFLSMYLSMLFMAFWNANLFIYRYQSSTYFLVLMLCAVCNGKCMEEKEREEIHG